MADVVREGIYAGLLLSAESVQVLFGEKRRAKRGEKVRPLGMYDLPELVAPPPFRIGWDVQSAETRLREAIEYVLATCKSDLAGLSIGSYGPLRSTSIDVRDKTARDWNTSDGKQKLAKQRTLSVYGQVWDNSPHAVLRGLKVYDVARELVGKRDIEVRVHSDVVCGAVAESLDRMVKDDESDAMKFGEGIVFFANVSSGVGATFARGGVPWFGAMHSECGFSAVQPLAGDSFAWRKFREAGSDPLYLEQLLSLEAILERTGIKANENAPLLDQLPVLLKASQSIDPGSWKREIPEYLAQLAYLATVMISPRRIVLHGPVLDAGGGALLDAVREAFVGWLGKGRPVYYDELRSENLAAYISMPVSPAPMLRGALLLGALPKWALRVPPAAWDPKSPL